MQMLINSFSLNRCIMSRFNKFQVHNRTCPYHCGMKSGDQDYQPSLAGYGELLLRTGQNVQHMMLTLLQNSQK